MGRWITGSRCGRWRCCCCGSGSGWGEGRVRRPGGATGPGNEVGQEKVGSAHGQPRSVRHRRRRSRRDILFALGRRRAAVDAFWGPEATEAFIRAHDRVEELHEEMEAGLVLDTEKKLVTWFDGDTLAPLGGWDSVVRRRAAASPRRSLGAERLAAPGGGRGRRARGRGRPRDARGGPRKAGEDGAAGPDVPQRDAADGGPPRGRPRLPRTRARRALPERALAPRASGSARRRAGHAGVRPGGGARPGGGPAAPEALVAPHERGARRPRREDHARPRTGHASRPAPARVRSRQGVPYRVSRRRLGAPLRRERARRSGAPPEGAAPGARRRRRGARGAFRRPPAPPHAHEVLRPSRAGDDRARRLRAVRGRDGRRAGPSRAEARDPRGRAPRGRATDRGAADSRRRASRRGCARSRRPSPR